MTDIGQYHLRKYTLNTEMHHLIEENLERTAKWLLRKTRLCMEHKDKAITELEGCGEHKQTPQEQWKLQVDTQTQPLPSK